jgi:asparagine synthase (glutamine-hydrolysing)
MCGITGGVGKSAPSLPLLEEQLHSIQHRGPDETGVYIGPNVSLGMCRLSIVEIKSGKQPSSDRKDLIKLIFNGEIYNYQDLKKLIPSSDVTSDRMSEGEVLIQLYLKFGVSFINKLNGMFAIALYDSRDRSLLLIRDRLGKKPLWVLNDPDGTLLFASEIRALKLNRNEVTFRPNSIFEVLKNGYINPPYSTYEEIQQVPPGSFLQWKDGVSKIEIYWKPDFAPKKTITYQDAIEETKVLIQKAVERRLISERPIGAFLSGGYDSTIITSYMSRISDQKVHTYSIGFRDPEYDESKWALDVAQCLGTEHHQEIIDPDPSLILNQISTILDQPFADSSIIPTYLLSKFARQDLVVALGGDGGDEIFGGYDRYLAAPLLQKANRLLRPLSFTLKNLSVLGKLTTPRKLDRLRSQLLPKQELFERYDSILGLIDTELARDLIQRDSEIDHFQKRKRQTFEEGKLSNLDRMVRSDLANYLPGDLLIKADIASMANSLELRSPFLDVEVVEWALTLPDRYKIKNFETKHILKDIARTLVPSNLIDRPKMGFAIPRASWLRYELRDMSYDLLTDETSRNRGWFDQAIVLRTLKEHQEGLNRDNVIWPMMMLELWARNWFDS